LIYYQKTFDSCRSVYVLPFDFYLPEQNICIEYDGEQHYKVIKYWGGENGFLMRQKRDKIKTDYCKDNNIKLIRIRYDDNLINELTRFLL